MDKQSILITGCSSGIGLCTAKRLKQDGYRVFATARKTGDVEKLTQQGFESFLLDYADSDTIKTTVQKVLTATGGTLYALFNNGAYGQPGAVEDLSREVLLEQFENNFFGWHELTNLVIPIMRKQGYGRIIQNSSVLGLVAMRFRGAYNASKYAIEGLNDTLRLELHGSNVFVSMIEPGPISSRFRANALLYFKKNINTENSYFKEQYKNLLKKLETEDPVVPFTLPADAVYAKVLKALTAKQPKAHYYVTFPTYLFGYLKRILSARVLDTLLRKI
ncbi:Putative NAD(P)-dependent oxidoreductase EC-YbbO [hydrothermal vent metagenome]|uniref:NAD(P)-dependent oxidoreductase EC-YbbO n=1 Tax=hydrothermal vent metagenome TaxID=652676 RepID=A0A3B0ZW59_9ZZZZ